MDGKQMSGMMPEQGYGSSGPCDCFGAIHCDGLSQLGSVFLMIEDLS